MASGRAFWQVALTVGIVGGILVGVIGTIFRSLSNWFFPAFNIYSAPDLVVHSLTAICVGYGLRPMVDDKGWLLAGLAIGCSTVLTMWLFPINAHSLPPFHWSALTVLPAGLAGMVLRETVGEG